MASAFDPIIYYILPRMKKKYNGFVFNYDFVLKVLLDTITRYKRLLVANNFDPAASAIPTSEIIKYICGYHFAYTAGQDEKTRAKSEKDQNYINFLTVKTAEAIFVIENLNTSAIKIIDEKHPIYCDFNILLDYMLTLLVRISNRLYESPEMSVVKMFESAFLKAKGLVTLLAKGLEKDALVVWRSLHEMECVLILLCKYGRNLINLYARFDSFDKITDNMPSVIREEYEARTKELNINLSNPNEVDHFENYGWITGIPDITITKRNLNFKFVEELAGLGNKYKDYQTACDALHMNSKVLKWNKINVFNFDVICCFNSVNKLIESLNGFLTSLKLNTILDDRVKSYCSNLKFSIDTFLNGNKF